MVKKNISRKKHTENITKAFRNYTSSLIDKYIVAARLCCSDAFILYFKQKKKELSKRKTNIMNAYL